MIQQRQAIFGRIPVGERLTVVFGQAKTALIPGDDPQFRAEGGDLRGEHLLIHQETVAEDQRQAITAVVGKVNALLVEWGESHGNTPCVGLGWDSGFSLKTPKLPAVAAAAWCSSRALPVNNWRAARSEERRVGKEGRSRWAP